MTKKTNQLDNRADQMRAEDEFNDFANYVATKATDLAGKLSNPEDVIRTLAIGAAIIAKHHLSDGGTARDDLIDDIIISINLVDGPIKLQRR